jgi:hypothetical protein
MAALLEYKAMQAKHLRRYSIASGLLSMSLIACGDDGGGTDAGPGDIVDANRVQPDVMNGVVCAGAAANYSGSLETTGAEDDGTNLLFRGDLNLDTPPDSLQLRIASNAATPTGTFTLPGSEWSVSICLDDSDGSCTNALVAFSGTFRVETAVTRLKANLDRVIFVDNLTTPTCSASVTQASLDVAIDAPP